MNDVCNIYNLLNLIEEPTCYKNPDNPSCIKFISKCFQSTIETRIDGNKNLRFSQNGGCSFKSLLQETKTKIIHYRNYKTFNANLIQEELNNELFVIDTNNPELAEFSNTVLSILDKYAPIKGKYVRENNSGFMKKDLRLATMQSSKLIFNDKTNDSKHLWNKQRNLCVSLLRKTKRDYSGTCLKRTLTGQKFLSALERCPPWRVLN